jgi:drug/metabolite transporter (DMT)-like permease
VAALWGTGDFLAALAARRFGAFRTLAVAQATELGLCVATWAAVPSLVGSAIPLGPLLLVGVVTAASYGALYRGLMVGPVMLVAPIASAYAAGPTVLAVMLLDERLSAPNAVGAAAAIAGVVVITAAHKGVTPQHATRGRSGVAFGLAAMVGFAISAFMIAAFARRTDWLTPLLISRVGVALILAFVALGFRRTAIIGRDDAHGAGAARLAAAAGLCNLAGTALYARAGELGLVAVVSAVSALFPLVPILGGLFLFHERLSWIQIGGIGVIIAGLVLLR